MTKEVSDAFGRFVRELAVAFERTPWFIAVNPRDAGMLSCGNLTTEHQIDMLKALLHSFERNLASEIISEPVPGSDAMPPALPGFTATALDRIEAGDVLTITRDPVSGDMHARRVVDGSPC